MKVLLEWIESNFENHDIRSVKVQKMEGKHDRGINCSNLLTLEEYERRRIGTLEEYLKRIRIRKVCLE